MRELLLTLAGFLVLATLLAGVFETALSAAWIRSYFTMGLPVFTRHVPATPATRSAVYRRARITLSGWLAPAGIW
jgi:hypothetical protein